MREAGLNRRITALADTPRARFAVRSAAVAYLVLTGAAMGLVIYLLACAAAWTSEQPGGFSAPVRVLLFSAPAGACLVFLFALATGACVTGVVLASRVLTAPTKGVPRWLGRASAALVALYIAGVAWSFTQADPVLFSTFALSLLLTVVFRWVVVDNEVASSREEPDYDAVECPQGLARLITGYCQLMVIWGSMECVMAMTYLAKVASVPMAEPDFVSVMGSGVTTGLILLVEGVYFIVCAVFNVRGGKRQLDARAGVGLLFAGLIAALSLLVLAVAVMSVGSPDGTEQLFCAMVSSALMAGSYARCRARLRPPHRPAANGYTA